jgi:hydrogenase/urease accessory protein HupE
VTRKRRETMAESVYALCALASIACALLLGRAYLRARVRLLLWSSICFVGLAINNVLLFVDLTVLPNVDLSLWRSLAAIGGMLVLVKGLIWDQA